MTSSILRGIQTPSPPCHHVIFRLPPPLFTRNWWEELICDKTAYSWSLKIIFLGIDRSFRVFYPTFDEWKSRFGAQSSQKKGPQKKKKWENAQKQPILGMFWCIRATKSVSAEFCCSCKVKYFVHFFYQDGWNSVESGFLFQKCWFFTKWQSFGGGNVP